MAFLLKLRRNGNWRFDFTLTFQPTLVTRIL